MNVSRFVVAEHDVYWPLWFRVVLISLSTLILCSCSRFADGIHHAPRDESPRAEQIQSLGPPDAQPVIRAQSPCPAGNCDPRFGGQPGPATLPPPAIQPWPPLGTEAPWPRAEYLLDGGDRELEAKARSDWRIDGLDQEDTIIHYDTVDGRVLTEPSNRVAIYAPRFRSVRRVIGPSTSEYTLKPKGYDRELNPLPANRLTEVRGALQRIEPGGELGVNQPSTNLQRNLGTELARIRSVKTVHNGYHPNESSAFVRLGRFEGSEMPFLAKGNIAAQTWTTDLGVQVLFDNAFATVDTQVLELGQVHIDQTSPKKPKMRIVKLASTSNARVGEFVEFTLRFDNTGDEQVGNVTIVDNLTPRLEYVPNSQICSVAAEFKSQVNEGDSLILRWEIAAPVKPGDGGIIRFRCKVR